VSAALAPIAGWVNMAYGYEAGDTADPWCLYDPLAPAYANDLDTFHPGGAVWLKVSGDCSLNVDY